MTLPAVALVADVTFQASTGLSKDRFENTFAFLGTGSTGADLLRTAAAAACKIVDYFMTESSGGSAPTAINFYLDNGLTNPAVIKFYDLAAAKPRPILAEYTFVTSPGASQSLPEEVALVSSWYCTRNIPSMRGRTYVGPFNIDALATGSPARPAGALIAAMVSAGTRLLLPGNPVAQAAISALITTVIGNTIASGDADTGTKLCVWSRKLSAFNVVTNGWIDNEWDGQSRRRVESSARSLFA
jgi:hypothetical protein